MKRSHALYLFLLLHIFPSVPTTTVATDFILLSCGASSAFNDTSNRTWESDDRSRASTISTPSKAINMHPSVNHVPYATARFFRSPFAYSFSDLTGPKFVRLYFYPGIYSGFNASQSSFSVTANAFTLLSNITASLGSPSPLPPSFMKEFLLNIDENHQGLELTFFPNPNSFAFINGIEIVSLPDNLYFPRNDVPIRFGNRYVNLNHNTSLENIYRLNVGGSMIEIQDDSGPSHSMFRAWYSDGDYIFGDFGLTPHAEDRQIKYTIQTPPYSAPETVYTTSRVTANHSKILEWRFVVDSGFSYLLRLHFCEFQMEVTEQNKRVFTIAINDQTVEARADVISWTGSTRIPIFKDYITWLPDDGHNGKQYLRLSLIPNVKGYHDYRSAFLNGLEIFKLNDSNWRDAAGDTGKNSRGSSMIYGVIGSLISALAVVAAISFWISRRRVKDSATATTVRSSGVLLPSDLCKYFSLDEIKTATCQLDDNFVIGKGGFGNVYKGLINNGATTVAIKRLNRSSNQGAREFLTEIELLSNLRHLHLVSLLGYCNEDGEMMLVYDYMAHGTLYDHLYDSEKPPLTWKVGLQICLGAAKGLHYLHTGVKHAIIHRDVKSTNILLDEKWVAKISDFGLSKTGPENDSFTHVTTNIKGTFGYLDPEYFITGKLTRKSDVYAFGVILFEVLSRRRAVDISLEEEQHSLAGWARYCIQERKVDELIDRNLIGQISPACLEVFVGIAGRCLQIRPQGRPAMADVVRNLELALQQTTDLTEQVENGGSTYSNQSDEATSTDEITSPK